MPQVTLPTSPHKPTLCTIYTCTVDARPKAKVGACFAHWSSTGGVPGTSSLGWVNLLEQLKEHRELVYLLDHWFTIKGCSSEADRWRRCRGQSVWKGHGVSVLSLRTLLSQHLCVQQPGHSLNPVLLSCMEGLCQMSPAWLNRWPLATDSTLNPSPLPRGEGAGLQVPILPSHGRGSWQPDPILRRAPKVTSLTAQDTLKALIP